MKTVVPRDRAGGSNTDEAIDHGLNEGAEQTARDFVAGWRLQHAQLDLPGGMDEP